MKFSLSFFLFLPLEIFAACEFQPQVTKIYSLSGPMTITLKELGLLNKPQIQGISLFHPISKDEFKGEVLPGGVFLSRESFKKFQDGILFYDDSQEFSKILKPLKTIQSFRISTRGLTPDEVTSVTLKELEPFVTGCEQQYEALIKKTKALEEELLGLIKAPFKALFFLGEIKNQRLPELLIVNDGFVKWLIEKGKLKTYPSKLAYVNWSVKIVNELPPMIKVGIKDSGNEMTKELNKRSANQMNLIYPGSLIPGITQYEALIFLIKNL